MANVSVVRCSRHKKISDKNSPTVYYIKQKAGDSKVYVTHVMKSFVRAMKKVLTDGNRVKVDGLGTFYITLSCPGVEVEKECTVKNVTRVNLRFKVDNTLRLVNDSVATTRGGENNVVLELVSAQAGGSGGDGGIVDDPTA